MGCALTHSTVPERSWVLVAASINSPRHSKGVAQAQGSPGVQSLKGAGDKLQDIPSRAHLDSKTRDQPTCEAAQGWAQSCWAEGWVEVPTEAAESSWDPLGALGVCWGFFTGTSKLQQATAGKLEELEDSVSMRRMAAGRFIPTARSSSMQSSACWVSEGD